MLRRVLKISSPKNRKRPVLPLHWIHYDLNAERDVDYVCYKTFEWAFIVGSLILLGLVADIFFNQNIFFKDTTSGNTILALPVRFTQLWSLPALLITGVSYLTIKLNVDIRSAHLPVLINKKLLTTQSLIKWIRRSILCISLGFLIVCATFLVAFTIIKHFNLDNNFISDNDPNSSDLWVKSKAICNYNILTHFGKSYTLFSGFRT